MSTMARRGAAAVMAVVASAGTGAVTNVATSGAPWSWWLALLVLVAVGAALAFYLSRPSGPDGQSNVAALGPGSVAVGRSAHGRITTRATRAAPSAPPAAGSGGAQGTIAAGPGSVAVGQDVTAPIRTEA